MTSRLLSTCLVFTFLALHAGVPLVQTAPAPAQAQAAITPSQPAPLDAVTLQAKVDELIAGHMKVNSFSGSVLLAKDGKPLIAKGWYAYNNSGYFLLGVVIEKITGVKYEQALQDMILTPLGLLDTGYDWQKTILPNRASGYRGTGAARANAPPVDMQHPYAAGSMYSTVQDLLKWDQALYTETLLPEAAKLVMWTPFKDNYAYGWSIAPPTATAFGGHKRIAHSGGINGFSAMIVRLPESRMTVIVLGNNESASSGTVARDIMAIYYGHKYDVPTLPVVAK